MKKLICKLLAVILLLGALTGVLTACKKDTSPEPDQYAVRMDFSIWSMWPEVTDAHRYTLYTKGYLNREDAITELNLDVDGCPRIHVSLTNVELYNITQQKCYALPQPREEYSFRNIYNYFLSYRFYPPGGYESRDLAYDIYDSEEPANTNSARPNCYQLQRAAGLHRLDFQLPSKDIAAVFTLNINLTGDSRAPVTLCAEESDDYTKLTNIDGRDLFIMKQGISSNHKFLPHIGVYNQRGETVLDPMFPTEYNAQYEAPHVKAWFAEMDEYYRLPYFVAPQPHNTCVSYPEKSGVYLVSFTYTGNELYQADDYTCYVVIP